LSIRFQADNDLKFGIVKAVRRREPTIDFMSAQEGSLDGVGDPEVLDRTSAAGRVLVTHDRRTMINHFRARLAAGKSGPGLLVVSQGASIGMWSRRLFTFGRSLIRPIFAIRLTTFPPSPAILSPVEPKIPHLRAPETPDNFPIEIDIRQEAGSHARELYTARLASSSLACNAGFAWSDCCRSGRDSCFPSLRYWSTESRFAR